MLDILEFSGTDWSPSSNVPYWSDLASNYFCLKSPLFTTAISNTSVPMTRFMFLK